MLRANGCHLVSLAGEHRATGYDPRRTSREARWYPEHYLEVADHALDLVRFGIRVDAACPGFIETPMLAPLVADPQEFEIEHRHQVATPNDAIRETGA